jgi:hypothetical protein
MRPQVWFSLSVTGTVLVTAMTPANAQPAPKLYDPPVMTTTAANRSLATFYQAVPVESAQNHNSIS